MAVNLTLKAIEGYPGYYATTDGRIWGKAKGGFLKQSDVCGYKRVSLSCNGKVSNVLVHRLIAAAFIPNPYNKPEVNHLDENPQNNCVSNLEWATRKENVNYGTRNSRQANTQRNRDDCSKPVVQMDTTGKMIAIYPSSKEAWRKTNIKHSHIRDVCNNKPKCNTAGGFKWRWADIGEYTEGELLCQF